MYNETISFSYFFRKCYSSMGNWVVKHVLRFSSMKYLIRHFLLVNKWNDKKTPQIKWISLSHTLLMLMLNCRYNHTSIEVNRKQFILHNEYNGIWNARKHSENQLYNNVCTIILLLLLFILWFCGGGASVSVSGSQRLLFVYNNSQFYVL